MLTKVQAGNKIYISHGISAGIFALVVAMGALSRDTSN